MKRLREKVEILKITINQNLCDRYELFDFFFLPKQKILRSEKYILFIFCRKFHFSLSYFNKDDVNPFTANRSQNESLFEFFVQNILNVASHTQQTAQFVRTYI